MIDRMAVAALISLACLMPVGASGQTPAAVPAGTGSVREAEASGRQVLVELYTSQGCNYCPTAERLLEQMAKTRGYGPDRVVTLAFHVDYFNEPWADPFSSRDFSGRQWAYHQAFQKRSPKTPDLYFTPMVMVDGRYPMSGYHAEGTAPVWPPLKARLDRALQARRDASMTLRLETPVGTPEHRDLAVRVRPASDRLVGKKQLLCVAVAEGPLSTAVPSGENAGATLVEHRVVRAFRFEPIELRRDSTSEATFSLDLGPGWEPGRCDLVAFLQDETTGAIEQVASIPWLDRTPASR